MRKLDIVAGTKYGRLTIVKEVEPYIWKKRIYPKFQCICDCGKEVQVRLDKLTIGTTKSCGCYNLEKISMPHETPYNATHGHTIGGKPTGEFYSWWSMKQRCTNPKASMYRYYGGRGIKICNRWINSFANFFEDMGTRLNGTTLDRIDCDGNYEPNNCRWADKKTQMSNRKKRNV